MRMFSLPVLIFVLLVPATAQESGVVSSPGVQGEVVKSRYDEAEDRTMTGVFIPVSIRIRGEITKLEISAHFSYRGRQLTASPDSVQIVLSVPCEYGSELDSEPIICFDGECSPYQARGGGACAGGALRERTSHMIDLPHESFLRITSSQKVTVQLQSSTVELTGEHIKVLQSLADRMSPKKVNQLLENHTESVVP